MPPGSGGRPASALPVVDLSPLKCPLLVDSVVRVLEIGQRLGLDRVDPLRFDLSQLASRTLGGAVLIAVGAFPLAGAWEH